MKSRLETVIKECNELVVYDTETSGFSKTNDRIIEFSGIKFEIKNGKFEEKERLDIFVNPGFAISSKITELTGITNEYLEENGVSEVEALPVIQEFMDVECVAGYNNATFDDGFMKNLYLRHGSIFEPKYSLDVLTMARDIVSKKDVENHKLATLADFYGVGEGIQFHSSIDDAYVTSLLLKVFVSEYTEKESEKNTAEDGKEIAVVKSLSYWEGMNHKMHRIYVNTNFGGVYFDTYSKSWEEKDKGIMQLINMEQLQADAFALAKVVSVEEFAKFKGKAYA